MSEQASRWVNERDTDCESGSEWPSELVTKRPNQEIICCTDNANRNWNRPMHAGGSISWSSSQPFRSRLCPPTPPALYTHLAAVSEVLPRHLVGRVDGGLGQHDEEGLSVLSVPGNVGLQGTRGYGDCWLTLTVWWLLANTDCMVIAGQHWLHCDCWLTLYGDCWPTLTVWWLLANTDCMVTAGQNCMVIAGQHWPYGDCRIALTVWWLLANTDCMVTAG